MLLKKTLFAFTAISLFATNVQANQPTQTASKAANTQKTVEKTTEEKSLKAFNQNVSIKLLQRGIEASDNQTLVTLMYEITNKGKNRIKNLHWLSAFTLNEQVFFVQEIQTKLDKAIAAKKTEHIIVKLPLNNLPENIRTIFLSKESPIGHLPVAKQIDFTNGKKIEVK